MNQEVKEIIDVIYFGKNHQLYLERCQSQLVIVDRLLERVKNENIRVIEYYSSSDFYPACIFTVEYLRTSKDQFTSTFSSKVMVCKVLPLFYVQHEFALESKDEDVIAPVLDGFGGQAYIKQQLSLHEDIKKLLIEENYTELSFIEMHEVICNLSFPENVTLFGNQVTLEYALFHDLLELCPDD